LSRIIDIPSEMSVVSREQLEHVATLALNPLPMMSNEPAKGWLSAPSEARGEILNRVRSYLAKLPSAISGQGGSKATFRAACVLVKDFALSIGEALPLLSEWNQSCQPPWSEQELLHKLEDAEKAPGEVGRLLKTDSPLASALLTPSASQPSVIQPPRVLKAPSILSPGTKVGAKDRDNWGEVVHDDGGPMVSVHFVSPEGQHATKELPRETLVLPNGSSVVPSDFKLNLLTSEEFLATDFRQHFLVKRLLVEGQCCILGGPKKVLKTSLLVDLALSLGTGTPFLSNPDFSVPDKVNVMLLSGESGGFTLKETAKRIALARGQLPCSASIFWGFELPQLSEASHIEELAAEIRLRSIKVVIVDPAYLCLLSTGANSNVSANVFAMGLILKGISEMGRQTGCTIIIAHHTRKADRQSPFAIPDLEDLSGSGFAEWARQWILLNRREAYQSNGRHALWITVGGSAGHSGTYTLDVDEGVMTDDFQGRTWKPTLTPAADAIAELKRAKEESREQAKD
jgi:hypothetical protein